jgi:hypothetical protein
MVSEEIADRLEGKTPNASAAPGQKHFKITVVYEDEIMQPVLHEIALSIFMRVPSARSWEYLEERLRLQLPDRYAECVAFVEAFTDEERRKVVRRLESAPLREKGATSFGPPLGNNGKPNRARTFTDAVDPSQDPPVVADGRWFHRFHTSGNRAGFLSSLGRDIRRPHAIPWPATPHRNRVTDPYHSWLGSRLP